MEFSATTKSFKDLASEEIYRILQLRARVFVVEQACAYNDLDGVDLKSLHIFCRVGEKVVGALRVYQEGGNTWIGRVVVDKEYRRTGLGRFLMERAKVWIGEAKYPSPILLNAQERYSAFYASLGYERIEGSENFEDGIPHIRMELK